MSLYAVDGRQTNYPLRCYGYIVLVQLTIYGQNIRLRYFSPFSESLMGNFARSWRAAIIARRCKTKNFLILQNVVAAIREKNRVMKLKKRVERKLKLKDK